MKNHDRERRQKYYGDAYCVICGGQHIIVFHHVDEGSKLFNIKDVVHRHLQYTEKQIRLELEKCVPLCINCHRKLHCGSLPEFSHLWNGEIRKPNPKCAIIMEGYQ